MTEPNTDAKTRRSEYARRRYQANRERILEQQREYMAGVGRDKRREWYLRNRERILEQRRAYVAANGDQIRAYRREYYLRNRERLKADGTRNRHGIYPADWQAMWDAQEGRCYLCGEVLTTDDAQVDHDHACCGPNRSCPVCRRGLAHRLCNVAVGQAGDDPTRLRRMADALEVAKATVAERIALRERPAALF